MKGNETYLKTQRYYNISSVLSVFLLNIENIHFMSISPIRKLSFPPERLEIKEEKTDDEGRRKL